MATLTAKPQAAIDHVPEMLASVGSGHEARWAGPFTSGADVELAKQIVGNYIVRLYAQGESGQEQLRRFCSQLKLMGLADQAWQEYRSLLRSRAVVETKKAVLARLPVLEKQVSEAAEAVASAQQFHAEVIDDYCRAKQEVDALKQAARTIEACPKYLKDAK